jgi:hypothetical protein
LAVTLKLEVTPFARVAPPISIRVDKVGARTAQQAERLLIGDQSDCEDVRRQQSTLVLRLPKPPRSHDMPDDRIQGMMEDPKGPVDLPVSRDKSRRRR